MLLFGHLHVRPIGSNRQSFNVIVFLLVYHGGSLGGKALSRGHDSDVARVKLVSLVLNVAKLV
jgi:hypothetical protein